MFTSINFVKVYKFLLLARRMGQYCFASWRLSSSVVYRRRRNAAGSRAGRPPSPWTVGAPGGRAADTARRASRVTSLLYMYADIFAIKQLQHNNN